MLRQARRSWRNEHEAAKRELFNAKMELTRLDLLIKAYETKLSAQIDPAADEWAETWEQLRRTKLQREAYFNDDCLRAWWTEREANSRVSAAEYPATEDAYFQEWLENRREL